MTDLIRRLTPRTLRNWIRKPRRSARYIWERAAYACGGADMVQIRHDWSVRCHPASRAHFEVFVKDPAQAAELDTFIAYCRPDMQFLDIGAHYGLFTLASVRYGGEGVRGVAVEASRKASEVLHANLRENNAHKRVQTLNAAMGDIDGTLAMLSTGPSGGDYFLPAPEGRSDTIKVPQISMATALRQTEVTATHVKMDIEGFESEVIEGAHDWLRQHRPILFLELHGTYLRARGIDPANVIRQLRRCDYTCFEENGVPLDDVDFAARTFDCRVVCQAF